MIGSGRSEAMKKNPGLREGDIVLLPTITHDARIWNTARVVWLGNFTFKAEATGGVVVTLPYEEEGEAWKRAA